MKTTLLAILILTSFNVFSGHCNEVSLELLNQIRFDAPKTLAAFDDVAISWVETMKIDCDVNENQNESNITVWLKPTEKAAIEYAEGFDGCAVEYKYKNEVLISKEAGCA